jgi:hypothetical protein
MRAGLDSLPIGMSRDLAYVAGGEERVRRVTWTWRIRGIFGFLLNFLSSGAGTQRVRRPWHPNWTLEGVSSYPRRTTGTGLHGFMLGPPNLWAPPKTTGTLCSDNVPLCLFPLVANSVTVSNSETRNRIRAYHRLPFSSELCVQMTIRPL